jgi:hypothetical protein
VAVTSFNAVTGLREKQVNKLECFARDTCASSATFSVVESQSCGTLAAGFLLCEFFDSDLALGLDVAGH